MTSCSTDADRIAAAASVVRSRWHCNAKTAVILGTGLGGLADGLASPTIIAYGDIPGFPRYPALAHKGRLVCGDWSGIPVIALQGRSHLYEGYSVGELTF